MNLFRNFSIKTRIFVTFLMVALFPTVVLSYILVAGIVVSNATVAFIGLIAVLNAVFTSILVASSVSSPIEKIRHSLQVFKTRKSAASLNDNGSDEVSEVSHELNRVFNLWNQEIVSVGKKQLHQEKVAEQNEVQLNLVTHQLEQTRAILQLAQTLNTTFDFQSNLKAILDEAVNTMNVQWASVLLIDREKHEMTVACVRGVERSLLDDLAEEDYPSIKLKPHEGLAGLVIKDGLPLIANKGHKDPRFKQFSEFSSKYQRIASLMCAPIIDSEGVVLGVLNFINRVTPPVFRNEDIPFANDLCTLAALVIERNRMYQNLFHDELTGLVAHNVWKGQFEEEVSRSVRYAQVLCLVTVEIDSFKKILTDTNGDFAGEIIAACGKSISGVLRDTDSASSIQERFFIMLPNTEVAGGVYFIGRLKEAMEKMSFTFDEKSFNVTASAGIACYPETLSDPRGLAKASLKALQMAREAGGNRATIHRSSN